MVQAETPYFVRRKSKVLPVELQAAGEKAHQVDWKRSVLLNLVTQTTYSLTVSACTREHLQSVGGSQALSAGSVQVMKRPCTQPISLLKLCSSQAYFEMQLLAVLQQWRSCMKCHPM